MLGLGVNLKALKMSSMWFQDASLKPDGLQYAAFYDFIADRYMQGGVSIAIPFTTVRASTKLVYNSAGLLTTVASNTLALDFNPDTLIPRGALIETSSANRYLKWNDFANAAWGKYQSSITANTTLSPDGTVNASSLFDSVAFDQHSCAQSVSGMLAAMPYTFSCYLKAGTVGWAKLSFQQGSDAVNGWFNLNAGVKGSVTAASGLITATSSAMQKIGNTGWYRCSVTATVANTTNLYCAIQIQTANSQYHYTGNGTNSIYLYGAQIEQGQRASSPIPTDTSIVTRFSDVVTAPIGPWFNAVEGTLFSECELDYTPAAAFPRAVEINDGTSANYITNFIRDTGLYSSNITAGSVAQMDVVGGSYTPLTKAKLATAFKLNDSQLVHTGAALTVDTACTMPTGLTTVRLGDRAAGDRTLNGWVSRVGIHANRLTQTAMQGQVA